MTKHVSLLALSLSIGTVGGLLGGCSTGTESDDATGEAEVQSGPLDDAFATTILAGGCTIEDDGTNVKTEGSGGKCPTGLGEVLDVLEATPGKFKSFAVSEDADLPGAANHHRFVVAAGGDLQGKLFIASIAGGDRGVEAIAFSEKLKAFVYYKEDRGTWVRKGDGTQVKAQAKGAKPAFECISCHQTGAPLMKELHDSWANWHSTWFSMPAVTGNVSPTFKRLFDAKTRADDLEPIIISATHLHSKGRVDRAKTEKKLSGVMTQLLCDVGEPSLIAVHSKTSQRVGKVSTFSGMLPTSIILNQLWTPPGTGTGPQEGLEQALKVSLPTLNSLGQSVDKDAYSAAIEKNGQTIGDKGETGDAMFAMSSPEKSYADLDAIQELLRQNLVDKDIVADVLMTDFTVSTFSKTRCDLAATLPDTWSDPAGLRTEWAKKLAGSNLRGAKGLAARLGDTNDLEKHTATIETFLKACSARKDSAKAAWTEDLLKIISQRRVEFRATYAAAQPNVIESDWLIPTDKLGSKAGANRLSATTCEIEAQSAKFVGEE